MDLKELIFVLDDFVDADTCTDLIDWFEHNQHLQKDGPTHLGEDLSTKKCKESTLEPDNILSDKVREITISAYKKWLDAGYGGPVDDLYINGYTVKKYHKNDGWFAEHIDRVSGMCSYRIFALLIYLNDVDQGGETEFRKQSTKVSAKRGRVLLFPCDFLFPHKGNIPISNDKYVVTMFICFNPYHERV